MTELVKRDAYKDLKRIMDSKGVKQKYVADKIGTSTSYLGQILNGNKKMSTDVAIKASQALELPIDIFLDLS